jgi:hypothetical protein
LDVEILIVVGSGPENTRRVGQLPITICAAYQCRPPAADQCRTNEIASTAAEMTSAAV